MDRPLSAFRLLAKTYCSDLISREQYVEARGQLLKKIQCKGKINETDLKKVTAITQNSLSIESEPKMQIPPVVWIGVSAALIASALLALLAFLLLG